VTWGASMNYPFNTTPSRSRNMRAVKASSNTTTELRLRAYLMRNRITGWTLGARALPGCPDFFFRDRRIAVFVDGCFWHGCPKCGHIPKTNQSYWTKKLARNKARDVQVLRELRSRGILVLRLWECELRWRPNSCLKKLLNMLNFG
jgi:DNA mismatch endonuclease (patch repair protein)